MTDDHDPFAAAPRGTFLPVPRTRESIAGELRKMANAEGEYKRFTYLSHWIKNVWHAAAEMLEREAER